MTPPDSRRYIPGLDGLRALAVLAVIAYHLGVDRAAGGLLGVDAFFVLSGYLITDQLLAEYAASGRLDLRRFWLRRARRLLPALYVMLIALAAWLALVDPARLVALRGDLLAALLYASNWWFIFHDVSYFARSGPPSPLGHLWSLAVEEQFYLVWPVLLLLGLRSLRRASRLLPPVLGAAAASALAMALLYRAGSDPTRVYDGTDTRAFALLIGAALALLRSSQSPPRPVAPTARLLVEAAGGAGLLVVAAMVAGCDEYESFLYRGGMVLVSLATAAVVAALTLPGSRLGRALGWGPLRWLGIRSYGIYLWHLPVIVLTTPPVEVGGFHLGRAAAQVAAILGLAAFSWRFVEEPVRRGGLRRWWEAVRARGTAGWRLPAGGWMAGAGVFLVVGVASCGLAGWAPFHAPDQPAGSGRVQAASAEGSDLPPPDGANDARAMRPAGAPVTVRPVPEPGRGVTAIGDSVLVGVAPYLKELLPGAVIDARVGRQLVDARDVVARLKSRGELGDRVIIELGTNGPFTEEQLASLLA